MQWQQQRAYPLTLFTEASVDLAEDEELMELMGLANFQSVFVGIESPNEASLIETKKLPCAQRRARCFNAFIASSSTACMSGAA